MNKNEPVINDEVVSTTPGNQVAPSSKPKKFTLRRETYKILKHYNKVQMENYLQGVYALGAEYAIDNSIAVYINGMDELLDKVPNMTPELKKSILDTIDKELK